MRGVERVAELREALAKRRRGGARVALVPTMGFLHEGHLRLVDEARRRADVAVMSIFVNPLQFGPSEDFARYPRDPEGDAAKALGRGVDLLFTPRDEEMYAQPSRVMVVPEPPASDWEGEIRPGHFNGVLTVVAKLFNLVQPDVAVFGQKDFQQAALIVAMARDLDFPVHIAIAPTVREADGLAMSSRNGYLDATGRRQAVALYRALRAIATAFDGGEGDAAALARVGHSILGREPDLRVDYLALVDQEVLRPVERAVAGTAVIVAARIGSTRLIDNVILGES
ncbi:MAG: pantoate--beta-alanine ligase [Gemmatimonadota bacterium]|nr:pantoate--beta-alanine ligase [Gemmatimonadota bacterium]